MYGTCPYEDEVGTLMTNFDHSIEPDAVEKLEGDVFGRYAGWNFNGCVWKDKKTKQYHCEVWVYGTPREVFTAPTLEKLMELISAEYGWE